MGHKLTALLVGIAGAVVVGLVILLRRDVRDEARSGPRWKRSLIAAGLGLLAALAPVGAVEAQPAATELAGKTQGKKPAADPWRRVIDTWKQLKRYAHGAQRTNPTVKKLNGLSPCHDLGLQISHRHLDQNLH